MIFMMSVLEYAEDINKTVDEVLKACKALGIEVENEDDLLDEDAIVELDNTINSEMVEEDKTEEEALEDLVEDIIEQEKIEVDNTIKKQKLKKRVDKKPAFAGSKKDLANKRKQMYKHKEKLVSNAPVNDDHIVFYKENMTIKDFEHSAGGGAAAVAGRLRRK